MFRGRQMSKGDDYKDLDFLIDQILHTLTEELGEELTLRITPIIKINNNRGRLKSHLGESNNIEEGVTTYIKKVAHFYKKLNPYIHQIQGERSADVWEELYAQLRDWAFHQLKKRKFPQNGDKNDRIEHADQCASEASATILRAHFPYDGEFKPWAYILLQHVVYKYLLKNNPINDFVQSLVEIDAWEDWTQNLEDPQAQLTQTQTDQRHDVKQAVEKLSSELRKTFIQLYYFENNSMAEIAMKMGKSTNALYKLHFDARKELSKILKDYRDNDK